MGTDLMKRFTCVSPVMTWGFALERFCRSLDLQLLADPAVCVDATMSHVVMLVDTLHFPKLRAEPINVAEILGLRKRGSCREWMYELEANEVGDVCKVWNDWVRSIFLGEFNAEPLAELENLPFVNPTGLVFEKLRTAVREESFSPSLAPLH
eukprot:TRINITY_DN1868_c0_g2_i1.p2 TRINITY_DN1868_c0_g2~~TRINITY_DN1868_c0_g2_i1.p2  ORF type:complete len:164 (+),score=35.95 TRINITY_DN1868_c0_g2_i1:39-494(+)